MDTRYPSWNTDQGVLCHREIKRTIQKTENKRYFCFLLSDPSLFFWGLLSAAFVFSWKKKIKGGLRKPTEKNEEIHSESKREKLTKTRVLVWYNIVAPQKSHYIISRKLLKKKILFCLQQPPVRKVKKSNGLGSEWKHLTVGPESWWSIPGDDEAMGNCGGSRQLSWRANRVVTAWHRGERLTEPSSSWFPSKFPSG